MKLPPRLNRRKGCASKVQHPTPARAWRHLNRLVDRGAYRPVLSVYRCQLAPRGLPHWHVGHRPGSTWSR